MKHHAKIAAAEWSQCGECALLLVTQLAEHGVEATAECLTSVLERVIADGKLGFLLVASEDNRIVGVAYAATLLSAEHCGMVSSLEELYVLPEYRGRGVGTELLRAVFERATADGMVAIELEIDAGHSQVIPLYERFGFRRLDRSRWLKTFRESEAHSPDSMSMQKPPPQSARAALASKASTLSKTSSQTLSGSLAHSLLALSVFSFPLEAQNEVKPLHFHVEHPTLLNLGFEWSIEGDSNRNAAVAVRFRAVGELTWRQALPLVRTGGENVYRRRENLDYIVPHGFAGSILNVQPGTEYECNFVMSDPDGVQGQGTQDVKVKPRAEPQSYDRGRILHVYPPDYFGPRQEPSFTGILQAYYGAGLGDWSVIWERRAQPGDILLLHAGRYKSERLNYVDPMMTPFGGSMSLTLKGTPDKPITIKAAGDGEVVIDGDGNHRLFDVMASRYHILENLTFRNTDVAIFAGQKEVLGAVGLTVRNCRFENVGFGVWTEYAGSSDFYIADNLFLGRDDRFRLVGWGGVQREPGGNSWPIPAYGSHLLTSYYAVKVYGPGHVIARNSIAYFHDGIGISTYGTPDSDSDRRASSIDIYGNDLHMLNDDFIETDGGVHNVRVFNNRGVNAAQGGYSSQPVFGGPVYFFRNLLYHVPSGVAFKFSAKPAGLFVWHNTIVSEHLLGDPSANMHFRNNLFLGRDTPGRGILTLANSTSWNTTDYNGYRPNREVQEQYRYFQPGPGPNVYEPKKDAWQIFSTLKEFQTGTGQEAHSMEVDFDIFEKLVPPDPANRYAVYHAMDLNFGLRPESKVVDAGVVIPTVNEDFAGRAPDLGALETGQPTPHYGPRWLNWQPFYR